ncbi:MAG: GNAT family N-acetyltransferase [Trebonia sp.]
MRTCDDSAGDPRIIRLDRSDLATARAMYAVEAAAMRAADPQNPPWSEHVFTVRLTTGQSPAFPPGEAWYVPGDAPGRVAGWYKLALPDLENRDRAETDLMVHPAAQRRGLGTALLRHAAGRAAANDRAFLNGIVPQGSAAQAFFGKAGATFGVQDVMRVLDLDALPAGHLAACRDDAARAAAGYSVVTWAGRTPDEHLAGMAALFTTMNDAPDRPGWEPDVWDERRIRERLDARLEAYGSRGYVTAALCDATGEMAAMSELRVDADRPQWGWQGNTAVTRPHRGHRLGLLVKAAMLEFLAEAEPGVRKITTFNATVNDHMIAINEALGFTTCGPPRLETELPVAAVLA